MSLALDIVPYIDGNGLVAPNLVPKGVMRGSDNGPLFDSIYAILQRREDPAVYKAFDYNVIINRCVGADGELHRAPDDTSPDEIDDYLGVLAGYAEFGLKPSFKLPFRLWRFPQLVFAYGLSKGVPSLCMPILSHINALVIVTSCLTAPASDSGSRQLNWVLIQATKKSLMAQFAGYIWNLRQRLVYKSPMPMKSVAALYYQAGHPLVDAFGRYT